MIRITSILIMTIWISSVFGAEYFVNDNSLTNDAFCTAVGSNSNDGASTNTPMANLEFLWDTYGPSGSNVITSGDIIYVDAGTYVSLDANINLSVNGITIQGAGSNLTVFNNNQTSSDANRWANITGDDITIDGVYLTGYNYGPGDASTLYINGASNLTITNIEVNENTSGGGSSAIVITGGSSVSFTGGSSNCNPAAASVAGGGANVEGNGNVVSFTDFTFSGNSKDIQGGSGLYISGDNTTTVTVTDCIIADNENRSASGGAAIFIAGANLIMSGTCINDNVVELGSGPKYGGAISVGRGATLTISDCSFSGNSITNSGKGGAISINTSFAGSGSAASVSLNSCSFTGNSASSEGNHIYLRVGSSNPASFTIDECTFSATAQDIRQDNSGIVSIQNSGTPVTSGTGITFTNNTPPATTPNTSCPTLVGPCYSVLPVELAGFTTECTNGSISIEWTTISERDNDYFIIERAGKGLIFESIDIISGIGNSQSIQHYSTTDNLPNSAIHYYRLIQVDKNGSRHIYETTSVLPCTNNNEVKVYFEGSNTLFFNSTSIELSSVQLTDLSGKLVSLENFSISVKEGIIHLDNIGSGVYLFIARTTFGEMITTRIYKQ